MDTHAEMSGGPSPSSTTPAMSAPAGGTAALDTLLDRSSADGVALRDVLAAWQHEQDRLVNRTWRRPGGLTRPAGL